MAKIVNVIYRPHLATFKAYMESEYRCCCVCDYEVIVQKDDGSLLSSSVMNIDTLREFDLDECVTKLSKDGENEDWCYPFYQRIYTSDVNNFINGYIESGYKPLEAFRNVLMAIRQTGCLCSEDVKQMIDTMLPVLEKVEVDE